MEFLVVSEPFFSLSRTFKVHFMSGCANIFSEDDSRRTREIGFSRISSDETRISEDPFVANRAKCGLIPQTFPLDASSLFFAGIPQTLLSFAKPNPRTTTAHYRISKEKKCKKRLLFRMRKGRSLFKMTSSFPPGLMWYLVLKYPFHPLSPHIYSSHQFSSIVAFHP